MTSGLLLIEVFLSFCQNIDDSVAVPYAPRIAKDIGPFLPVTSEDTLTLVLETLAVVVQIDDGKWITEDLARALVVAILDVWMKNNKDPIFISIMTDVVESLASSPAPGVYPAVVQQALPPLSNAISTYTTNDSGIAAAAIDLVNSIVEGAPDAGLGDGFIAMLAPSLFGCLASAEDRDAIQVRLPLLRLRLPNSTDIV